MIGNGWRFFLLAFFSSIKHFPKTIHAHSTHCAPTHTYSCHAFDAFSIKRKHNWCCCVFCCAISDFGLKLLPLSTSISLPEAPFRSQYCLFSIFDVDTFGSFFFRSCSIFLPSAHLFTNNMCQNPFSQTSLLMIRARLVYNV